MRKPSKTRIAKIIAHLPHCVLFLLCAACLVIFGRIGNTLVSQQMAERYRGGSETRFAQVSAYFPIGKGVTLSDVYKFRQSVEKALTDASLEAPEGGNLWVDAYSAEAKITVKGTKGSASVTTLGVGGDWFAFHPLQLRSGGYLRETDLMHDKVVLDETLAWKLFGGVELAGMTVTIDDKPYLVAGVISREDDFASRKAYSGEAGMFMYYDTLNGISETNVSCYELVCANPISGFALDIAETGFTDAVTLQNTGRFSLSSAFGLILNFGERSISSEGVVFPYWENAARYAEDYAALMLALAVLFGLYPLYFAVRLLVGLFKRLKKKLSVVIPALWEKISDNMRERRRLQLEKKSNTKS